MMQADLRTRLIERNRSRHQQAIDARIAAPTLTIPVIVTAQPVTAAATPAMPGEVLGEIRKGSMLGLFQNMDTDRASSVEFYFDGDLDGSWTLIATPMWLKNALIGERDIEGVYSCDDYTTRQLMEIMWRDAQKALPTVLSAVVLTYEGENRVLESLHRIHGRYWLWGLERQRAVVTVDQLNDNPKHTWEFVVWNHPMLEQYPRANAIIMSGGRFYTALVDKQPENCA